MRKGIATLLLLLMLPMPEHAYGRGSRQLEPVTMKIELAKPSGIGETRAFTVISYDDEGIAYQERDGSLGKLSWASMTSSSVYQVHFKALSKDGTPEEWDSLARLLSHWPKNKASRFISQAERMAARVRRGESALEEPEEPDFRKLWNDPAWVKQARQVLYGELSSRIKADKSFRGLRNGNVKTPAQVLSMMSEYKRQPGNRAAFMLQNLRMVERVFDAKIRKLDAGHAKPDTVEVQKALRIVNYILISLNDQNDAIGHKVADAFVMPYISLGGYHYYRDMTPWEMAEDAGLAYKVAYGKTPRKDLERKLVLANKWVEALGLAVETAFPTHSNRKQSNMMKLSVALEAKADALAKMGRNAEAAESIDRAILQLKGIEEGGSLTSARNRIPELEKKREWAWKRIGNKE